MSVELATREEFAVITLNRPEALNALSAAILKQLGEAFDAVAKSKARALVVTGAGNKAFCERLGSYHRVLTYDALDELEADVPCVYVDFAGDAPLRRRIHERFSQLKYSCSVGATHVDDLGGERKDGEPHGPVIRFASRQADADLHEKGDVQEIVGDLVEPLAGP